MTCPEFDYKGFVLEELPAAERRQVEEHLAGCEECLQEVEGLRLTLTALKRLPAREIPRRIAFVSDPVFEPTWWQRFWSSAPRLGFASAVMLSLALLVHAFVPRQAAPAPAPAVAGLSQQQIEAQIQAEVARRLPEAVDAQVQTQLKPAMTEMAARLQTFEKRVDQQRNADLRDVSAAFDGLQKRVNNIYLSAARMGGD